MAIVNVIQGGGAAFDSILYPEQNLQNQGYLYNQLQNFSQSLNDVGKQFMESARDVYAKINSSEAVMLARSAIRAAQGIFHPNQIVPLMTINDLQMAKPVMQRWVMACPDIRELHLKQQCAGYGDTYVDIDPGKIRDEHYDYRRVMDGAIIEDGDDWYCRTYAEDLFPGDRELDVGERQDILKTWDLVSMFVHKGEEDPTDPYSGHL